MGLTEHRWFLPLGGLLLVALGFGSYLIGQAIGKLQLFVPKPGSCLVLEEKHCQEGQPVESNGKFAGMAFNLPANTPVFAPYTSSVSLTRYIPQRDGVKYPYSGITMETGRYGEMAWEVERRVTLVANYQELPTSDSAFNIGQIIGRVTADNLEYFGDYNLLVVFTQPNETKHMAVDEAYTKQIFNQ